jgi:integrase
MKIYKNEKGKWCYRFMANGQQARKVVGLSKQECEAAACAARDKIKRSGFGLKGTPKNLFFEDFAKEYLDRYSRVYKRSWRSDETSCKHLAEFFKGKYLSAITRSLVEHYQAKRKDEVAPATVNLEIACLKKMLSKAVDWDYLDSNVAARVKKFKLNNARERVLDADEARRLIECAAPALQPVLIIALKTGMRRGEILSLKWSDVNFIKAFIQIKDTKSGEPRKVPLSPAAREALKALPRTSDFIFYNAETKTHVKSVVTAFDTACTRAEIKGLRFHDLRHTFATWYMERGGDVVALSKILGHHSLQMTLRYCNPTEGAMLQAVEKMDAILGKPEAETGKNLVIEKPEAVVTAPLLSN